MTPRAITQRADRGAPAPAPGRDPCAGGGWIDSARRRLLDLRAGAGWGYRPGAAPGVEPSVLAALALLATDPDRRRSAAVAGETAGWLASLQQRDGSLGVSAHLTSPGWTTPLALLLWAALGSHPTRRGRGARFLLEQEGEAIPPGPGNVSGHDTMLVGWPWVADTHSWLEPTAVAVLALRREGFAGHPRVREGLRLIRDRAIATGGWNYGNTAVFGRALRPQPATTGLALLALAGVDGPSEVVREGIQYLQSALPEAPSAQSLCWGLLGLRAWGLAPARAGDWLAEIHETILRRGDSAPRLAWLLLAASGRSLELLGIRGGEAA